MRLLAASFNFILWAAVAQAQSVVYGFGVTSYESPGGIATASIEYQFEPFRQGKRLDTGWTAALSVMGDHGVHAGFGLVNKLHLNDKWSLESSIVPGLYARGVTEGDLGSVFEIRSLFGVVRTVSEDTKWSVAVAHTSNASTASFNPGSNALIFRWHKDM